MVKIVEDLHKEAVEHVGKIGYSKMPNAYSLPNTLRCLAYAKQVFDYYAANGNEQIKENISNFNDENIMNKLKLCLIFSRGQSPVAENFEIYCVNHHLIGENKLFISNDELHEYVQLLNLIHVSPNERKKFLSSLQCSERQVKKLTTMELILSTCQKLDSLQGSPEKKVREDLFKTLNQNSKYNNTKDMQILILFAQLCIETTGDKLTTAFVEHSSIQGVNSKINSLTIQLQAKTPSLITTKGSMIVKVVKDYDEKAFMECSRLSNIGKTIEKLDRLEKPKFFMASRPKFLTKEKSVEEKSVEEKIEEAKKQKISIEKILDLITSTNAAIRIINASPAPKNIGNRYELEQLVNSQYVRPVRAEKLKRPWENYYDLKTDKFYTRKKVPYVELKDQEQFNKNQKCNLRFKTAQLRKEDKGKPKKTHFTKKQSYTILVPHAKLILFRGTARERWISGYFPVGTLYDVNYMYTKGERFIWSKDVSTSGVSGFFWIPMEIGKRQKCLLEPGKDKIRYECFMTLSQLQAKLKEDAKQDKICEINEVLFCGSLESLKCFFAVEDTRKFRLAALYVRIIAKVDYGIDRPIIILDGNGLDKVKEYTNEKIIEDLLTAIQARQNFISTFSKWWSPIENNFLQAIINVYKKEGKELVISDFISMVIDSLEMSKDTLATMLSIKDSQKSMAKIIKKVEMNEMCDDWIDISMDMQAKAVEEPKKSAKKCCKKNSIDETFSFGFDMEDEELYQEFRIKNERNKLKQVHGDKNQDNDKQGWRTARQKMHQEKSSNSKLRDAKQQVKFNIKEHSEKNNG